MSESQSENPQPQDGENKIETPTKRTPSKRRATAIEKAQRESEELIKNMGGSLDVEGGRKTRSSTRGTPVQSSLISPPSAKKPRTPGTPRGRGRQKKIEIENENHEDDTKSNLENSKTPRKGKKTDVVDSHDTTKKEIKKLENSKSDDDNDDGVENNTDDVSNEKKSDETDATSKEGESEVDAKVNSIEKQKLESISEESHQDKKQQQDKSVTVVVSEDKEKSPEKKVPETTKPQQQQLDKVEPMEVDGAVISTLSTTKKADDSLVSIVENAKNESQESTSDATTEKTLQNAIEKNDSKVKGNDITTIANTNNTANTTIVNEKELYTATEKVRENSIVEKQPTAEHLPSEKKIEESNKSGNDVCEPKLSTQSNPGEVVAAQPCN